jgi:DNA-binding transcriptional LysR family regulator
VARQQRFCDTGAAVQGLGICQLPDFYLRDGMLAELLADERSSDQAIWAVFPQRSPQRSRIAALIRFLQADVS